MTSIRMRRQGGPAVQFDHRTNRMWHHERQESAAAGRALAMCCSIRQQLHEHHMVIANITVKYQSKANIRSVVACNVKVLGHIMKAFQHCRLRYQSTCWDFRQAARIKKCATQICKWKRAVEDHSQEVGDRKGGGLWCHKRNPVK